MRKVFPLLAFLAVASAPFDAAVASDLEEGGKLYAVQNRKHLVSHEFGVAFGFVPLDAFYKGITASFAYTYHFNDMFAWEIVNGSYSFNLDTGLRGDLETNFGVQPTEFPELQILGSTNFVLKPLYGKFALFNSTLMYAELFMIAGPAVAQYENAGIFVGFNVGGGARLYLTKYFSVRFETRQFGLIDVSSPEFKSELHLQVGLGLNIP
jgi:outer membrane beta-barrel protein